MSEPVKERWVPSQYQVYHITEYTPEVKATGFSSLEAFPAIRLGHSISRVPVLAPVLVDARVAVNAGTALEPVPSVVLALVGPSTRQVLLHPSDNLLVEIRSRGHGRWLFSLFTWVMSFGGSH